MNELKYVPFSLNPVFFYILSLLLVTKCAPRWYYQTKKPPPKGVYHIVKPGQTLWRIAKTYGVSLEEVAKVNNIEDTTRIVVGQHIFIPGATKVLEVEVLELPETKEAKKPPPKGVYHIVKPGQTLWRIAKTYGVSLEEVVRVNGIEDATKVTVGQYIFIPNATEVLEVLELPETKEEACKISFIWPVKGEIISNFGSRGNRIHSGIDIKAPEGTDIVASADGVVSYSGRLNGYGNLIIVKHNEVYSTVYAHNQMNLVKENDKVKMNEIIAKVGNTGKAACSHLHFEVRKRGRPENPLFYLP